MPTWLLPRPKHRAALHAGKNRELIVRRQGEAARGTQSPTPGLISSPTPKEDTASGYIWYPRLTYYLTFHRSTDFQKVNSGGFYFFLFLKYTEPEMYH